jgi:hypothetical protein
VVIIHQDSFAADYQDDKYALFVKALKFAGLHVIGKNRETLTTAKAALYNKATGVRWRSLRF